MDRIPSPAPTGNLPTPLPLSPLYLSPTSSYFRMIGQSTSPTSTGNLPSPHPFSPIPFSPTPSSEHSPNSTSPAAAANDDFPARIPWLSLDPFASGLASSAGPAISSRLSISSSSGGIYSSAGPIGEPAEFPAGHRTTWDKMVEVMGSGVLSCRSARMWGGAACSLTTLRAIISAAPHRTLTRGQVSRMGVVLRACLADIEEEMGATALFMGRLERELPVWDRGLPAVLVDPGLSVQSRFAAEQHIRDLVKECKPILLGIDAVPYDQIKLIGYFRDYLDEEILKGIRGLHLSFGLNEILELLKDTQSALEELSENWLCFRKCYNEKWECVKVAEHALKTYVRVYDQQNTQPLSDALKAKKYEGSFTKSSEASSVAACLDAAEDAMRQNCESETGNKEEEFWI
ncbi:MAG: hypothetical protein M1829_006665 [Trizodia sp. TS-e1964]|nr:MAG: hypothetical protein M1829_006665 [Trizodia sp. TS-e1964]